MTPENGSHVGSRSRVKIRDQEMAAKLSCKAATNLPRSKAPVTPRTAFSMTAKVTFDVAFITSIGAA